jgi:hypothetical protein
VFKACTALLKPSTEDEEVTKGTVSIQNAVDQINMQLLHSPNDKKLKKTTVYNAIARGSFGVSPLKNGRPRKVLPELTCGLACHAVMMQASGKGEASSLKMRAIAGALMLGTQFENKFSTDYLWQRTRIEHPKMIYPAKAIDNEDRHVDWLTYKNINDWNKRAKEFLIDIGMCTPERGLIRKSLVCLTCLPYYRWTIVLTCLLFYHDVFIADAVESEVGLVHEDDVDRFLTLNETHYEFSIVGAKGGATVGRYINPSFPRSGERCIVSNFHTTGVFGTTLRGEPLPPGEND